MSFSGDIKKELSQIVPEARHCQLAELSALIGVCGKVLYNENGEKCLKISSENISVIRKCFTLLKKTYNISTDISIQKCLKNKNATYEVLVDNEREITRILQGTKLLQGDIRPVIFEDAIVEPLMIQMQCCKRSFIRGYFLACGSMSNPKKSYHLEWVCQSKGKAEQVEGIVNSFGMDAKIVIRKKSYIVYLKEGAQIVDVLNIMEAHVALMELENVRIIKEMRNAVNRKVNCETANINKTVSAAVKQVNDIVYIRDCVGLESLAEGLQELAELRLQYQDASLIELGGMLSTPVGKSGVNHRMRKLAEVAEKLKRNQEERL